MGELMPMTVEVWPVAADEAGIWLLSGGDAWRYGPVEAASDVHYEVELLLFEHGIDPGDVVFLKLAPAPETDVLHMTSGGRTARRTCSTYMAVVDTPGVRAGDLAGRRADHRGASGGGRQGAAARRGRGARAPSGRRPAPRPAAPGVPRGP